VRRRLGLSQRAFAARLDVGRNMVIRWEGGDHRPRAVRLNRIAKLGGVTAEWLLDGGEGRGQRRDRQWEEAVAALRTAWPDQRRRAALLMVLRAMAGERRDGLGA
jgi:transcriptional regulator with XRE-family HTH domain